MIHATLLICAYFKTESYYFCVLGIEITRNWRITSLVYFVLKFLGFSIFLFCVLLCLLGGHGGRVVTLSPPTSEAGVRSPVWPQVEKLVVACRWSAVYSTEP